MEDKIIYDDPKSSPTRFYCGLSLDYIHKDSLGLLDADTYRLGRNTCHDFVRSTRNNLFILYPKHAPNLTFLKSWLDEIAPVFPALDIKILRSNCSLSRTFGESTLDNSFNGLSGSDPRGNPIYLKLKFGEQSNQHYGFTNKINFTEGSFLNCLFVCRLFIKYCVEIKADVSKVSYLTLIDSFLATQFNKIKEEFTKPIYVELILPNYSGTHYIATTDKIVDLKSVTPDVIGPYLTKLVTTNTNIITAYFDSLGLIEPSESNIYIQALYSKKTYVLEAYLAHHFIRAGLSYECEPFIKQYFKIKAALPDEYFWNLIFLTQFGFNYFYYYWLTDDRHLRFTTKKVFEDDLHRHNNVSSQLFFSQFHLDHNKLTMRCLKDMYLAGDFKNMASLLGNSLKVSVKPEKREIIKNLRIAESYTVSSMDEKYFHLRGDDFRIHKYAKQNFDIV